MSGRYRVKSSSYDDDDAQETVSVSCAEKIQQLVGRWLCELKEYVV